MIINSQAKVMIEKIDLSDNKNALLPEEIYFIDNMKKLIKNNLEILPADIKHIKHINNVICW